MTAEAGDRQAVRLAKLQQQVDENPDSAALRAKLGGAYLKVGSTKKAEAELNRALTLDSTSIPALINLGGIYLNRWDFAKCVEVNERAAKLRPDLLEAHYNQGLGHLYLKQPDAMVECFRRVIELDENHSGGHYHLAVALLELGQKQDAEKELAIAMRLGYKPEPALLKALEKK